MAGYFGNIPTPQATQTRDTFTATSGQTSFATSGYTVGMLDVYLNGIKLASADFTATNGSDVVLASGASADDILEVVSFSTFESDSGTFTGAVTVGGDLTVDTSTLKVDSSNNRVGIGTASPHTTTEIVTTASGSVSESLQIRNNATASGTGSKIRMINSTDANSDANSVSITSNRSNGDNFMTFETEDTERMRIDVSGRIICGRTAPISSGGVSSDHTFEQLTDARWAIATHHDQTSNYGYAPYYATAHDGTGNHFLFCRDTGATRLKIQSDGDVANHDNAYGATSDERIKQDIKDANSQWDDIKALKVRNFKKKDDVRQYGNKAWEQIGVIAQELEAAGMTKLITESPPDEHDIKSSAEFGTLNEDGTIKEVKANVKDVKYSVLYMKAVKALQEAMTRIETLETKVKALEDK